MKVLIAAYEKTFCIELTSQDLILTDTLFEICKIFLPVFHITTYYFSVVDQFFLQLSCTQTNINRYTGKHIDSIAL